MEKWTSFVDFLLQQKFNPGEKGFVIVSMLNAFSAAKILYLEMQ